MTDDRTVHAGLRSQWVVRYDRAGKWRMEYAPWTMIPSRFLSLAEAVNAAIQMKKQGGDVFLGKPGGGAFDRAFQREFR